MLTVWAEAVNALVNVGRTLPGVDVVDGPPISPPSVPSRNLYVGWDSDDISAESLDGDAEDLTDDDRSEVLRVSCAIEAFAGDNYYEGVRASVVRLLEDFRAALAADPTLGGLVYDVRVRRPLAFDQEPLASEGGGNGGVRAASSFAVTVRRF